MSDYVYGKNSFFEALKKLNQALRVKEIDFEAVYKEYNAIEKMLEILGVFIPKKVLDEEDKRNYALWNEAKASKDFETADKYRAVLIEKGIL